MEIQRAGYIDKGCPEMGLEIFILEAHSIQKYMEQYLWTRGVRKWIRKYLFWRHNLYENTQRRIHGLGVSINGSRSIYSEGTIRMKIHGIVSMRSGCPEIGPEIVIPKSQSI